MFVLDQPADTATLLLEGSAENPAPKNPATAIAPSAPSATSAPSDRSAPRPIELRRLSPTEFGGEITFKNVTGYQVRAQRGQQSPGASLKYNLRALPDQPPQPTLTGPDKQAEVQLGGELRLKLAATDDYGLVETGLFARHLGATAKTGTNTPTSDDGWQVVAHWPQPNLARQWQLGSFLHRRARRD